MLKHQVAARLAATMEGAHAQLRPGVSANGERESPAAAVADLREALIGLIAEFGVPDELTLMVDVA